MRYVRGFLRFWYDFIVGDDWKIAVAVLAALGAGALAVLAGYGESSAFAPLVGLGVLATFAVALLIDVRRAR
jgi:hypothetical protein